MNARGGYVPHERDEQEAVEKWNRRVEDDNEAD